MGDKTQEYDNSLGDFIERVRSAFVKRFPNPMYSDGSGYVWVADVFQDKVIVKQGDKYFEVAMTVKDDSITFAEQKDWKEVRLSYVAETLAPTQVRDVMLIWEFKGSYPEVDFAAGVDVDALTDGDKNPVFVILPIGKANVTSGNKRYYDSAFVTELEKQVLANKPIGLMGHLSEAARATEFPAEAVHWVGAKRVGELLWGKGYLPPGDARDRLKRYKASGKKIATSIDAVVAGVWDDEVQAYRMNAKTLQLNQIDIAPADRAGIGDLAAVPHLTKEMANGNGNDYQQEVNDMADKTQLIRELTADDARLLPEAVRAAIVETVQPPATPPEVAQVATIRETLGLAAEADLLRAVQEMRQTQDQQRQAAITGRVRELVEDAEKGVKLVALRGMVTEMIRLRNPQTVAEVDTVFAEVVASPAVTAALAGQVQTVMGPPQRTMVQGQNGQTGRYFNIPAEA